jgi:hypothetical protein
LTKYFFCRRMAHTSRKIRPSTKSMAKAMPNEDPDAAMENHQRAPNPSFAASYLLLVSNASCRGFSCLPKSQDPKFVVSWAVVACSTTVDLSKIERIQPDLLSSTAGTSIQSHLGCRQHAAGRCFICQLSKVTGNPCDWKKTQEAAISKTRNPALSPS